MKLDLAVFGQHDFSVDLVLVRSHYDNIHTNYIVMIMGFNHNYSDCSLTKTGMAMLSATVMRLNCHLGTDWNLTLMVIDTK